MTAMKTEPNYFRASLGMKQEIAPAIAADYHSGIVDWMRANGNVLPLDGITFRLAKEFGFCYGVDKAVDMAYETRLKFPDRRIFLTYEIIHNPSVNNRLKQMGIEFLSGALKGNLTFDDIGPDDVVIMPAFGVPAEYLQQLRAKGSVLVDTTCGSVVHVWKRVEKYAKDGYTSLVHGKALHAETLATVSQAQKMGGHTIVVLDKNQAQLVCDIITGDAPPESIAQLGPMSLSREFDPRKHLDKIGVANQTTMLANESLEIAAMIGAAMEKRHGRENLPAHFRSFDTICSATQERQDAIVDLVQSGHIDMMLVIGGYNSSNTGHLLDIAAATLPAWHISDAAEILSASELRHQPAHEKVRVTATDWLPRRAVSIGLTAGASTPNKAIGEVIERLAELRGVEIPAEILAFKKT
ncbi:MAG TPA: 4-hydroxy-3-methylbut-2-enyl diphosphate reductase [Candidatus Sumerlaeota bacterium]|nr:4-hydroxy-3-methylbut-2-enyl diphosphate reductase [Candidatus Sumerlaeota bacterium]